MPPEQRDMAYAWDIIQAAETAIRFVEGITFQQFAENEMLLSAVVRQLTIVGEAARRVSEAFKAEHPEIPWREMIAQRNVLVHDYGAVVSELVWLVVTEDLPALLRQIEPLVHPPDQES